MKLKDNPLFAKLISLDLPKDDYAVFGSGPLYAHGLREEIHDIDMIARGEAWKKALTLGEVGVPKSGDGRVVVIGEDEIEVLDKWGPGEWDTDELIDTAEEIEGIRFVTLATVLKWKKMLMRPKDLVDIERIEKYLESLQVKV